MMRKKCGCHYCYHYYHYCDDDDDDDDEEEEEEEEDENEAYSVVKDVKGALDEDGEVEEKNDPEIRD